MNMSLPQLSAIVSGYAGHLHSEVVNYYHCIGNSSKDRVTLEIKQVKEALEMLEQELQKLDIFIDTRAEGENE